MVAYNVHAPDTIGEEWMPTTEAVVVQSSPLSPVGLYLPSTATETIDELVAAMSWNPSPASGYGRQWLDLYDLSSGSIAPGVAGVTELKYAPNEDKTRSGTTWEDFATTAPLYSRLSAADDSGPPEASGYVLNSQFWTTGSYVGLQFNTVAIPSTWRVAYVRFEVRAKGFDWSWQQPKVYLDWYNGATLVGRIGTISPAQDYVFRTTAFGPYYLDFYNEGPWLQPEVAALDDNTKRNLRITMDYCAAVSRVTMIVGVITENRVAVAIGTKVTVPPAGVRTDNPLKFKTPLNVDNWAKTSGTNLLGVLRRLEDPFGVSSTLQPQIITIDSGAQNPQAIGSVYTGLTFADQSGVLSAQGALSTVAAGVVLGTSGGALSVDGQPYWDVEAKIVSQSQSVTQQIANATATPLYARLRAKVALLASALTPQTPLVFGLRKTSTADMTEAFTGAIPATLTAGSFTAGAAASAATNQLVYTTGVTANAYARHRTTNAQSNTFMLTGKITFASIASAHYGLVNFSASTTYTSTGTNPGLTSGYMLRFIANGGVSLYSVGAATAGTETLLKNASFAFVAGTQYSFKVLRLSQGFIGFKVWATASAEPDALTFTWTDATYSGTALGLGAQNDAAGGTSRTVSFDDWTLYNMLTTGDLAVADLTDSTIVASTSSAAFTPGTMTVYDATITMDTAVNLAAATDYTIETGSVTDPTRAWYILWLDSTASHGLTGNVTYGGSTDAAAPGGGVATAAADFMLTLGSIPTPPASITVTKLTYRFDDNGGGSCDAGSMEYAHIAWTSGAALGASHSYWEIQRSYDLGGTWSAAATIATEATLSWDNKEVRRGIAVMYRVRVVRTDGAQSTWRTETGSVTCARIAGVLAIVSDYDATAIGGFVLLDAQYPYSFRDQSALMDLSGRDLPMGFKSQYDRGFIWQFRVLIYLAEDYGYTTAPAGGAGVQAFTNLRTLARKQVPYFAVLTPDGEVLCGMIDVGQGLRQEPARYYTANVTFTQLATAPKAVTL